MNSEQVRFQLKRVVSYFKHGDETIFVDILGTHFLLQGEIVTLVIWDLFDFLKAPRTLDDIIEKFGNVIDAGDLKEALIELEKKDVVERYMDAPKEIKFKEKAYFNRQLSFLNFYKPLPGKSNYYYFNKLRKSNLLLINLQDMGREMLLSLVHLGVNKIYVVDNKIVEKNETGFDNTSFSDNDVGKTFCRAVQDNLAIHSEFSTIEFHEIDIESPLFKDILEDVDLIVCASDYSQYNLNRKVNRIAFEKGKTILFVESDRFGGQVGPAVIPNENACFECYVNRTKANIDYPEQYENYIDHVDKTPNFTDFRTILPIYKSLANQATIEIMKILSGYLYPKTYKGFIRFDFINNTQEFHNLLKLPYCNICGYIGRIPPAKIHVDDIGEGDSQ